MKDARFIAELIEKLEASYNIDRSRIYVNGFSNGGGMSFALSCAMPNRIAAVGLVGAALTLPFTWCADHHAVPLIVFHGTDDPEVPYRGGWSWVSPAPFPPVERFAAQWARRNGCAGPAVDAAPAENVVRREYTHCANASSVVLFSVRGGGHTWPGGGELPEYFVGPNTTSISATREMWTFFRAHPLAR